MLAEADIMIVHSLFFGLLFDRNQPYMALVESSREDPIARLIVLIDVLELGAIVIPLLLLLAHIVDADYVSMADEHVHGKVDD